MDKKLIVWFKDVDKNDIGLVGGKGANLGEMTKSGFPVPQGFIVTSEAYYQFLKENDLSQKIKDVLEKVNYEDSNDLNRASQEAKNLIIQGNISEELKNEVINSYKKLIEEFQGELVAVRSSATAEDLPNASFAGQQETFLNVKGEKNLLQKLKEAWASLFDGRAIFYRHENRFDHFKVGIAIPVQKMVESDASGIMFTLDPVTNDDSKIVIEAIFGLGELIVQGAVTPDHYEVAKESMNIANKKISTQTVQLIKEGDVDKEVQIETEKGNLQKITDGQILKLAELGKKLEEHYQFPQDSEWAIEKNNVYLVQTRPITTIKSTQEKNEEASEKINLTVILKGDPASPGIASGPVKVLQSAQEIDKVVEGDVLVAPQTNPDFVPAMKKAVAIVTDKGGRTSHAAIVSREIGIPAVVGTAEATVKLKEGLEITVNGATGEIYEGYYKKKIDSQKTESNIQTRTKVYVNLGEPEFADKIAKRHVDGVGLLRAEFMMAGIGKHPKKFINEGKQNEFIDKLAEGLEKFCQVFNPRPVVYRASDFKTNEYRNLEGGSDFEPEEPNPMLGYRGAYRYIKDPDVFKLELEAIKKVRNEKGLKNLWLMIPFVRTVDELIKVKELVESSDLKRSPDFKLWMMVEIPSNVILLEDFIKVGVDGVSVGSNDLTMLVLGTDRDNNLVAKEFNEENQAILWALERVVKTTQKYNITSSLCGQAASTYPRLLDKLVDWGITSVSVSPDMIDKTRELISGFEKESNGNFFGRLFSNT
ncbi:MAG: phosphoenolpyruvate synthase [Candidatus Levybacteria bacterium]|nr:phosphoenolpyruvate synthase [Candidatus Levybacteria bacterium]